MGLIDRWFERRLERIGSDTVEKSAGFMALEKSRYPSGRPGVEDIREYEDFVDAYKKLPWLYAGALAVAIAVPKANLRVYSERSGERVEVIGEDINALMKRPNPHLSYRELIQITAINMQLTGNQYWNLVGTREEAEISSYNPPVEIWWIKPEDIEIKTGGPDDYIEKYIYQGGTKDEKFLDPSEVIHFKLINPDSYYLGMGALEPAKNSAILEFNAIAYNKSYFENDAMPPFYFSNPDKVTLDQIKQHRRAWNEMHKGKGKAGKHGYCYGGMEIKKLGTDPKDASYIECRKMNREEILATLGVPPSIVGLLEYANYSNMEVQQRKFWEDAVQPIAGLVADKLTLQLAPLFDESYFFEFDYSNIKVLQEDEERKANVAVSLVSAGVKTINEIRADMYNLDPVKGGDVPRIPISMVELGGAPLPKQDGVKALPPTSLKSFWEDETKGRVLYESFVKRVDERAKQFEKLAQTYITDQLKAVRSALKGQDGVPQDVNPGHVFDEMAAIDAYIETFRALYVDIATEAGEAGLRATEGKIYTPESKMLLKDVIGDEVPFELRPEFQELLEKIIVESGTNIAKTTMKKVRDLIKQAAEETWTIGELVQNLLADEDIAKMGLTRAQLIARTEAAKVDNLGQLEGYKQNPYIEYKVWLSAFAPDTRETHAAAHGQKVRLDEPFNIGGAELMYPGDGGPEDACNCLCDTAPVVGEL